MYRLHAFFTQNSMKPLYVLEELGVEFEYCYIDLMTGENRTETFGAMTPIGKVPVLEHNGQFLFESGPICRYVASEEKSPLFPADKLERARVDQWMTYFTCHPGRWLTSIFFERIVKPKANLGETNEAACEEAAQFVNQQFANLEVWLGQNSWLANDAFSIADCFALGYMEQVNFIGFGLDDYPNIQSWFAQLEALESTERARARVRPYMQAILS